MNSVLVNFVLKIFIALNNWYEHSLTHKVMKAIFGIFKTSVIWNFIAAERNYWNSRVLNFLSFKWLKPIFMFFDKLLKTSFLFKIALGVVEYSKTVILNSTPIKLLFWFIDSNSSDTFKAATSILGLSSFVVFMSIVPHEFWSNFFILGGAILLGSIFIFQIFTEKIKFEREFITPSLVLFTFFAIISLFTGFGGGDSFRVGSIMFASIAISIITTYTLNSIKKFRIFIGFILIALVLTALYGIFQFVTGIEIRLDFIDLEANPDMAGRLFSTMGNPNNYAKFITMFLPFIATLFFIIKGTFKKLLLLAALGLIIAALLLTLSRASYLAIAGSVGVFVLVLKPRLVPVALGIGLLSVPFWPDFIMARLSTLGTDSSSIFRMWIWEGSLRMLEHYFITGVGMGPSAFRSIYLEYSHELAGSAMHSHNVFLNVWLELGIGGFLAIIAYNFSAIKKLIITFFGISQKETIENENTKQKVDKSNFETSQAAELKLYIAAALSSITAFLAFAMVEHVWFYPRTMLTYFIMMGMIFALIRIEHLFKNC
ncbi:MAG: O-antigen ligase family protein [Defluviitaleaceae bacterium]|nr:O-antigen ligase family protein [Defluviitaleaceae bacterium]